VQVCSSRRIILQAHWINSQAAGKEGKYLSTHYLNVTLCNKFGEEKLRFCTYCNTKRQYYFSEA